MRSPRDRAAARAAILAVAAAGCAGGPFAVPLETQPRSTPFLLPVAVNATSRELVWERSVDVLHQYKFRIARENRPAGTIESEYKVGSGLLEPWHHDSVGLDERLESTLQSIRRRVIVRITPDEQGDGYLVGVEAFKEREDLVGPAAITSGGATLNEYGPAEHDLRGAVDPTEDSLWVPLGRDVELEADMIASLQLSLAR